jgi:hypothetical protein
MTVTDTATATWLQSRNTEIRKGAGVTLLQGHPNYPAWRAALEELGQKHGLSFDFRPGFSVGYVNALVAAGADPEQIKTIHMLVFG